MDTNRIRYFLALARTGSVTKAAQLNHISPAALSKAMRVLEGELGEKLLVPEGRGILLTDRARALVPEMEEIVRRLDVVLGKRESEDGNRSGKRPLRLATFEVFSTHFLERALASPSFAGLPCTVHEMSPGKMEDAVAARNADYALTYIPIPHPELDHLRVISIEMGIYGLRKKFDNLPDDEMPFVIPTAPLEGSPNKVRGLDGWPDDAFPRNVVYRVGMLETALGLCRRGLAVAYIPRFIAHMHNEVVRPEFALEAKTLPRRLPQRKEYVYLVKRKADLEDERAKKLGAALRLLVSDPSAR